MDENALPLCACGKVKKSHNVAMCKACFKIERMRILNEKIAATNSGCVPPKAWELCVECQEFLIPIFGLGTDPQTCSPFTGSSCFIKMRQRHNSRIRSGEQEEHDEDPVDTAIQMRADVCFNETHWLCSRYDSECFAGDTHQFPHNFPHCYTPRTTAAPSRTKRSQLGVVHNFATDDME